MSTEPSCDARLDVTYGVDDYQDQGGETLYKGFFTFERRHYRYRRFDGQWSDTVDREVHVRPDAVGVLLYDPVRDVVVLVEQIRAGVVARLAHGEQAHSPWLLEPVAGLIDRDESPEEVARREAEEEANCTVNELIPLYRYYTSPGASCERFHLFCALVDSAPLGGIHGLEEEHEDIRVRAFSFPEISDMMKNGRIDNAMALISLQWLAAERSTLRARS